eukprot:scaffold389_cov45-Attheya_sp.AAC.1
MTDDLFYIRRQKKEQRRREKLEKKTQQKNRNSPFSVAPAASAEASSVEASAEAPTARPTVCITTATAIATAHSSGIHAYTHTPENALMAAAKRIERQRKLEEQKKVASTSAEELQKTHLNSDSKNTFRRVNMPLELADSNSGPDIYLPRQQASCRVRWKGEASQEQEYEPLDLLALARVDLVEAARRLEKKRAREAEEQEERKRPRNPIALAKQEILDKDTNPVQSRPIMNDNDRPSDVSSSASIRTTKVENDEEEECKLFPQLEGSIFSLEKLEPFPLPTGSQDADATQHELPAALNRYLKPYQREGISFLYSAVIKGSGVILGDDMGLGKT